MGMNPTLQHTDYGDSALNCLNCGARQGVN
jgi:hypothetical protein